MARRYDKLLGIWNELQEQKTPTGFKKVISPYTLLVKMGVSVYEYNELQEKYIAGVLSDDERMFAQKLAWCIDDLLAQWSELALQGKANYYAVKDIMEKFNRAGFVSEKKKSTMADRIKSYQKLQETKDDGELKF